jgi:lysozyme family protein
MRYGAKWPQYAKQWDGMKIKAGRQHDFDHIASKILASKARYEKIQRKTGVPWWLVAVLHTRESDGNFHTYLGNGQPLNRVTTIVPKGRGPFATFEAGAEDALKIDGLSAVKDWRLEKALYYCETFNGWGYANKGLPSPYIFGGTSVQKPGKYVADGKFNSKVWDAQPGCAPIIATLAKMDNTIEFVRET